MLLHRSTMISLFASATVLGLSGCIDEDAARRAEVGRSLEQIEFRLAMAHGDTGALERIDTELKSLRGGSKGQQAAISMLRAGVLRTLAVQHVLAFDAASATYDNDISHATVLATVTAELDRYGSAHGDAFQTLNNTDLAARRAASETTASIESSQIAQLEGPIESLVDSIATGSAQSRALRTDAGSKLQDASAAGHTDGLATLLEALAIQREADAVDKVVALSEIDLELTYQPDLDLATARQQAARQLIEEIGAVTAALQETVEQSSASAGEINAACASMGAALTADLDDLAQLQSGELSSAYASAMVLLDEAAQAASTAASGLDRSSRSTVRALEARILLSKAELALQSARGLEREARLRSRIDDAQLPGVGDQQSSIDALNASAAALLEAAPAWYEEAINLLGDLGAEGATIIADLQGTIDSVHGLGSASTGLDISIGGGLPTGGPVDGGVPPTDPEFDGSIPIDLLQMIQTYNAGVEHDPHDALAIIRSSTRATTPEAIAAVEIMTDSIEGMVNLDAAMRQTFGPAGATLMDSMSEMMGGGAGMLDVDRLTMTSPTSGAIPPTALDPTGTILTLIDGVWMIDADAITAAGTPGLTQTLEEAAVMVDRLNQLAADIAAGKYATPMEAIQSLQP